jgi:hypothetical protein
MVVTGVGEAPMLCLLREGRLSTPPSPFEVVWNSSVESLVMARGEDGGPQRVDTMAMVFEPSHQGERLKPSKQSTLNSRLPKQIVSLREKPSHDRQSLSIAMVITDVGTIGTSRGKACCKSPFLTRQLLVFSMPSRTRWSRSCVPVPTWSCKP